MGVQEKKSSGLIEGLYGVLLLSRTSEDGNRAPQPSSALPSPLDETGAAESGQSLHFRQLWKQMPSSLNPIQCSVSCDKSISETVANVVTSLPFIVLGLQAPRKNLSTALYANSLIGVGLASSLYHSSRGEIRKVLRWADYTMIAATTVCLSRALRDENPKFLMAASTLLLPFQPLVVSAVHTGMMEVSFARKAASKPELRTLHNLHTASSLLGGALFIADDCFPETPYIHAAWHVAAAIGVGTCNKLLE